MRILLDTHVLLWWLAGDSQLPPRLRRTIGDEENIVLVSAASAWEIATKVRLGKLPSAADLASDIGSAVVSQGFVALPVTIAHAQRAGGLPGAHRDPFDRMLIAQSQIEDAPLASNETLFDSYGINRLW